MFLDGKLHFIQLPFILTMPFLEFEKHIFYFLRVNGRNMSVNQRVFSIAIGAVSTALSFKTTSIILVILRKTIIFAHSDAGSTASGVSFYRSYKIIFVGGNQMRQRSFFDFRLNFRYAKIRFILLICNILHV